MRILGIDPGSRIFGYAVFDEQDEQEQPILEATGSIVVPNSDFAGKLLCIYSETSRLIVRYEPNLVAIENVFLGRNAKSLIVQCQARAAHVLAAATMRVPVIDIMPSTAKKIFTGNGRASKEDVQRKAQEYFGVGIGLGNDATDAVAIAYSAFVVCAEPFNE